MKNFKKKGFLDFDLEDVICANFRGHFCNQRVKIRRYTIQSDRRYLLVSEVYLLNFYCIFSLILVTCFC